MKTYQEFAAYLGDKERRSISKILHVIRRDAETIVLHSDDNDLITYSSAGRITANTGGWQTRRNATLIKKYTNFQLSIASRIWFVRPPTTYRSLGYVDGMYFENGEYHGVQEMSYAEHDRVGRLRRYARNLVAKTFYGQPSFGYVGIAESDCVFCSVKVGDKLMGEVVKGHIVAHIGKGQYPMALIGRAIEGAEAKTKNKLLPLFEKHVNEKTPIPYGSNRKALVVTVTNYLLQQGGFGIPKRAY